MHSNHVSIPVPERSAKKPARLFSFIRTWKRAPRWQKNLSFLILFATVISVLMFSVQISQIEGEEEEEAAHQWKPRKREPRKAKLTFQSSDPGQEGDQPRLPQLDDIQKKAIRDLENKIQEEFQRKKPIARKYGPPFRGSQKGPRNMELFPLDLDQLQVPVQRSEAGGQATLGDGRLRKHLRNILRWKAVTHQSTM